MPKVKGTGFCTARKLVKKRGREFEEEFLKTLTPAEANFYHTAMAIQWYPINDIAPAENIMQKIGTCLYPETAFPLRELGKACVKMEMQGLYNLFFRIPKVSFFMEKNAQFWRQHHDTGKAKMVKHGNTEADLIIEEFPDLPKTSMEMIIGYTLGIVEMTGNKNPQVTVFNDDPNKWILRFTWS